MAEPDWERRVRSVVAAITDGSTASPAQLLGLSDDVLQAIEADQPGRLPGAYRLFLELIGGGAGLFMAGSAVYYPGILGLRQSAHELLAENEFPFELKKSDRVVLMHQGYSFDFLRGSGPDPEVWSYTEGVDDDVPKRTHDRFTDWLREQADRAIPIWATYSADLRRGEIVRRQNLDGSVVEHHRARSDW